jgi:CheY-like chemotaxis protein
MTSATDGGECMERRKNKFALLVLDEEMEQCLPAEDGCTSLREVFSEHFVNASVGMRIIQTNEELLDYLYKRGQYENASLNPLPDLIIIDYYNPKTERKEALEQIKSDQRFQFIPIIILSRAEGKDEISDYYKLRANSYIEKPKSVEDLAEIVEGIRRYWFETTSLPESRK